MTPDALSVAMRLVLYADLLLLVGLAAFPLHARAARGDAKLVRRLAGAAPTLAALGIFLSAIGAALQTAAMFGVASTAVEGAMILSLMRETDVGASWAVRLAALAMALVAALMQRRRPRAAALGVIGGGMLALATLAWTGHAAASEGVIGTLHRASDVLHLLAAAIWLGAIAALWMMVLPRTDAPDATIAAQALDGFAPVGTACVAAIAITGAINGIAIVGSDNLLHLPQTLYGLLLGAKLALFALMLGLAAANRWRLTPRLSNPAEEDRGAALRAVRISLLAEMAAGAAILALVAWLGTLAPLPTGGG